MTAFPTTTINAAFDDTARQIRRRLDDIRLECVRTLYKQTPNSFVAAMGVTLYMVVTMWNNAPHVLIAAWLGIQALAQAHRFWILHRYRRVEMTAANSSYWAFQYTLYMGVAGIVWAFCPFFFFR